MHVVGKTLKKLFIYYLLKVILILPLTEMIPDQFPTAGISSVMLMIYALCLLFYYLYRVPQDDILKSLVVGIAVMLFLFVFTRCMKYHILGNQIFLSRYMWYLFYLPVLTIPQLFFFISLMVYAKDTAKIPVKWHFTGVITGIFIILVMTNDLHQLVFRFRPGFENWDDEYTHEILYYLLIAWGCILFFASIIILLLKCRLNSSRIYSWLILLPFFGGVLTMILLISGKMPQYHGHNIIQFPETFGFMTAEIMECCIQLGLIPTNKNYRELMNHSLVSAQITDTDGNVIYHSAKLEEKVAKKFGPDDSALIGKNRILRRLKIPGGYAFWQEDITELRELAESLSETKEKLREETELIRLKNELRKKQVMIEQRSRLYHEIDVRTEKQSKKISSLAEEAFCSQDPKLREKNRKFIILLGAYLKRYANLMLLSDISPEISVTELGLAIAESLRYLNYYGIPGEIMNTADGNALAEKLIGTYEFLENMLENNLSGLRGVYVHLSCIQDYITVKITLEGVSCTVSPEADAALRRYRIFVNTEKEDENTYFRLTFQRGDRV